MQIICQTNLMFACLCIYGIRMHLDTFFVTHNAKKNGHTTHKLISHMHTHIAHTHSHKKHLPPRCCCMHDMLSTLNDFGHILRKCCMFLSIFFLIYLLSILPSLHLSWYNLVMLVSDSLSDNKCSHLLYINQSPPKKTKLSCYVWRSPIMQNALFYVFYT